MSTGLPDDKIAALLGGPEARAAADEPSTQAGIQSGFEEAFGKVKDKLGSSWQDVRTLYQMAFDKSFQMDKKTKYIVIGALAYLVSPVDLLPERVMGPLGYADDVAVLFFALKYAQPEIERYRRFKAGEAAPKTQTP